MIREERKTDGVSGQEREVNRDRSPKDRSPSFRSREEYKKKFGSITPKNRNGYSDLALKETYNFVRV